MGWHRTRELEVKKASESSGKCGLWTRGGLEGVEVHIDDKVIQIPREAILDLVASEYISKRVSKYEQMDTGQAIADMMGESR